MVHLYKELQPVDRLSIRMPFPVSSYDRQLITLLYQPLIGAEPISLYFMLWAEGESTIEAEMSHYHLMNSLDMPIAKIFESRIALEAIGLMRTWRKDSDEVRSFMYDVMPPLEATAFFNDPLLSMFLFSKIGEQSYRQLRQRFIQKGPSNDDYQEVSRTFTDVYRPVQHHLPSFANEQLGEEKEKPKELPFNYEEFDFSLLRAGLSEQLVPSSALTAEANATIAKLAFLYHLTPLDMQKVVMLSLDDHMTLSESRLKKSAADYYKLTVSTEPPAMQQAFQSAVHVSEEKQTKEKAVQTKEEQLIHYLDTTAPIDVLRDIANGREPIPADIQLAQNLVMQYQMPIGVVNALLQYVLLRTDMKLSKSYVEKIASHWIRKGVKTTKEAIDLARKEHKQYMEWKTAEQKPAAKKRYSGGREEKVPDWFNKNKEKKQQTEMPKKEVSKEVSKSDTDFEEERRKILQKLGIEEGQVDSHGTD
ncbi:DnaD domain protein [Viridibacillus sp. YIM B01967]|uniref:DnaD domain protein n=1 Tax=Viridibacillus soli TaxID=2798301 RepID=A0ABS1H3D1_9BACL|nr:DnaD domain protein [Viridibacillus soli]